MTHEAEVEGWSPKVRAEAIRILAEVENDGWSDRLLQSREERFADPRERGFLHVLVLTTLRWQGALDHVLAPLVHGGIARLQPAVRAALRMGLCQGARLGRPAAVAVDATVEAMKNLAGPRPAGLVNAVLRQAFATGTPALDEMATIPAWLRRRWTLAFGAERTRALVAALNRPAAPFAVARPDRGGPQVLAEALKRGGVETRPARRHPWGLAVLRGAPQATTEFRNGDFLLMDEAAALVALLAAPTDDRPIADLTAAPGAKAALLAQSARGPLVALELLPQRVQTLRDGLSLRAPPGRVASVLADAKAPPLRRHAFGSVLLDAPCSGAGTLRRRPEKRHRLAPEDIAECARRQTALLAAASELVDDGGALVYAVCSLEPEEGRDQVTTFLAGRPDFHAVDPAVQLGDAARDLVLGDPPLLVTRPDEEDLDGFVAARLVRRRRSG